MVSASVTFKEYLILKNSKKKKATKKKKTKGPVQKRSQSKETLLKRRKSHMTYTRQKRIQHSGQLHKASIMTDQSMEKSLMPIKGKMVSFML